MSVSTHYILNLVTKQFANKLLSKDEEYDSEGLHVFKIINNSSSDKNCEYYFYTKGSDSYNILMKNWEFDDKSQNFKNYVTICILIPQHYTTEVTHSGMNYTTSSAFQQFDKYIEKVDKMKLKSYVIE